MKTIKLTTAIIALIMVSKSVVMGQDKEANVIVRLDHEALKVSRTQYMLSIAPDTLESRNNIIEAISRYSNNPISRIFTPFHLTGNERNHLPSTFEEYWGICVDDEDVDDIIIDLNNMPGVL